MCKVIIYREELYEELIRFLDTCFPESGRQLEIDGRHSIYKDIAHNYDKFLCLMEEDKIIGTVAVRRLNAQDCELKSLFIYKEYYGRGLGYRLLTEALSVARELGYQTMYLDSMENSKRALFLYVKAGFVRTERYNENEHAQIFMKRNVGEAASDVDVNVNRQEQTKKRFEWLFEKRRDYYETQTKQDDNKEKILESLHIEPGKVIADVGTGTGYLAFSIAKLSSEVMVYGLDIVQKTLVRNREQAEEEKLENLSFVETDGIHLPLEDASVDVIVTRFALHHFTDIETSFQEFNRVLKQGGQLFICDPTPDEKDQDKFVDEFMKLVPDGHVTFYTKDEFDKLAGAHGFRLEEVYLSDVYFPSEARTEGYIALEQRGKVSEELKKMYCFEMIDGVIWAREKVINLSYIKE